MATYEAESTNAYSYFSEPWQNRKIFQMSMKFYSSYIYDAITTMIWKLARKLTTSSVTQTYKANLGQRLFFMQVHRYFV